MVYPMRELSVAEIERQVDQDINAVLKALKIGDQKYVEWNFTDEEIYTKKADKKYTYIMYSIQYFVNR